MEKGRIRSAVSRSLDLWRAPPRNATPPWERCPYGLISGWLTITCPLAGPYFKTDWLGTYPSILMTFVGASLTRLKLFKTEMMSQNQGTSSSFKAIQVKTTHLFLNLSWFFQEICQYWTIIMSKYFVGYPQKGKKPKIPDLRGGSCI